MAVKDYHSDPDLNTTISGINIAEGCPPSGINNAIRQLMADAKTESEEQTAATERKANASQAGRVILSDKTDGKRGASASVAASELAVSRVLSEAVAAVDAANATALHLSGSETVNGVKTFGSNPVVKNASPSLTLLQNDVILGAAPSSNAYANYRFADSEGDPMGILGNMFSTSGQMQTYIVAYHPDGSGSSAVVSVRYPLSGMPFATAPSTPSGSVDAEIVTADFLKAADARCVHLTGNETLAGTKTFSSSPMVKNTAPQLILQQTDVTMGAVGTAAYSYVRFNDVAGNTMGLLGNQVSAVGNAQTYINAYNFSGSGTATVGAVYPADGTPYGIAPTPSAESATNHIATTGWVRAFSFNGASAGEDRAVRVPPMLHESMMTPIFELEGGISSGLITLSQPYTDFAALCILFGGDTAGETLSTHVVTVWELEQRRTFTGGSTFALLDGKRYWYLNSATSTTTSLDDYDDNCRIYKIWGLK